MQFPKNAILIVVIFLINLFTILQPAFTPQVEDFSDICSNFSGGEIGILGEGFECRRKNHANLQLLMTRFPDQSLELYPGSFYMKSKYRAACVRFGGNSGLSDILFNQSTCKGNKKSVFLQTCSVCWKPSHKFFDFLNCKRSKMWANQQRIIGEILPCQQRRNILLYSKPQQNLLCPCFN
jgi:hypothetical protein